MDERFLFVDESGNLDFSPAGSVYFVFVCVDAELNLVQQAAFHHLRKDLLRRGSDVEYFHASENKPLVRQEVYRILNDGGKAGFIAAFAIRKAAVPENARDPSIFYQTFLPEVLARATAISNCIHPVVITDAIPTQRKRKAIGQSLRRTLGLSPDASTARQLYHHDSKAYLELQAADYYGWAIWRHLTRSETLEGRIPGHLRLHLELWPTP